MINKKTFLNIFEIGFLSYSYSLQIYFDFFGYSLCAIALGKTFGINLPSNFLNPYSSRTPREFWQRWHVTLSRWLRDYVYIPLGGNKKYTRNIIFVFMICGIWHGSNFNFLLWGIYHGFLIILHKQTKLLWESLPDTIQLLFNFSLISFGWIFFIFDSNQLTQIFFNVKYEYIDFMGIFGLKILFIYILFLLAVKIRLKKLYLFFYRKKNGIISPIILGVVMLINIILMLDTNEFIYFRF